MNYQRHYDLLIERAKVRVLTGYKESHHIVPRCLGGGNEASNLVDLTAEEHFLAHQLLVKIIPGHKMIFAAHAMMMAGIRTNGPRNKSFGWLRRLNAKAISERRTGARHSAESRAKMSELAKRRRSTPESRAKASAALKGRVKSSDHVAKGAAAMLDKPGTRCGAVTSEETRRKQSAAATGRKYSPETIAKMVNGKTAEQRRAAALKAWETKRAKASQLA